MNPTSLVGEGWLALSPTWKARLIDSAIDAELKVVDLFPGKIFLGEMWVFMKEGLLGFYGKLKSSSMEVKIRAIDKMATIIAGRDEAFAGAFLKGLLKGFFIDGALGIFIAIWDLIKGLGRLWDFIKSIDEFIGGFPGEIRQLIENFKKVGQQLVSEAGSAIEELKKIALDPKGALAFMAMIASKAKAFARQAGEKIAGALLSFLSKPEASAEIGETAGSILGMILWEIAFAAVTAGGGAAVTAVKEAAGAVSKLVAKVVEGILKVVQEIRVLFGKAIDVVKELITFVRGKLRDLGSRLAGLLDGVGEFFGKLLRFCHESKLVCTWPKHHPWPQYLGGLREQTLKKLPRKLHETFHIALDRWKNGKYSRRLGSEHFVGMNKATIIKDLREFYTQAEGGVFAKYLPDLEQAIVETLKGVD